MSVSDREARAVLKEHGREVGNRGRLSGPQWEDYHAIMGTAGDDGHVTDIGDPGPVASAPVDASSSESTPVDAEQPPRRVGGKTGSGARGLRERLRGSSAAPQTGSQNKKRGPAGGRGKRARQPWRPTAAVIEHTWSRIAQAAGAVPPLQRILAAQAQLAGVVFESQLRETFLDRLVLQPAARFEATGEAVSAMIGVPAFTLLTVMRGRTHMELGEDGQPRPAFKEDGSPAWDTQTELGMIAPLRYCLISWLAVSERHADQVIAQAEATLAQGKAADEIIAWIFARPDPSMTFEDVAADARGRARDFTSPPPPRPGPGGSSAFRPALSASVLAGVTVE